jgi:hypothetical protein
MREKINSHTVLIERPEGNRSHEGPCGMSYFYDTRIDNRVG